MSFSFPPPPRPIKTSSPCSRCGTARAVPFYATVAAEYLKCVGCGAFIVCARGRAKRTRR